MKASCSMFGQIRKFIPRAGFERIVKEPKTGHRSQSAIKNSVLLRRLNGLNHSRRRRKHFTGSTLPGRLNSCAEQHARVGDIP